MTKLYFKVLPDSPVMKHIDAWKDVMTKRNAALKKLRKELGIPKENEWYGWDHYIAGVGSPRLSLPGWRWDSKKGFNVPALLTPEGKAIKAKLKAIPCPKRWDAVSEEIFQHDWVSVGMSMHWASFGWTKLGAVVQMHAAVKKAAKTWPDGLVEITGSEAAAIMAPVEEEVEA